MSWPGATAQWETGATLYYEVAMRLKPASLTDITVAEQLEPEQQLPDGAVFATTQRVTWPDGTADARTEYRFTEGSPSTLQLTYAYEPPSTGLVKSKKLPDFHQSMQRVIERYLDNLTASADAAT